MRSCRRRRSHVPGLHPPTGSCCRRISFLHLVPIQTRLEHREIDRLHFVEIAACRSKKVDYHALAFYSNISDLTTVACASLLRAAKILPVTSPPPTGLVTSSLPTSLSSSEFLARVCYGQLPKRLLDRVVAASNLHHCKPPRWSSRLNIPYASCVPPSAAAGRPVSIRQLFCYQAHAPWAVHD
jgi:hypothetical protein